MNATKVKQYTRKTNRDARSGVEAERARILKTVSQKANDKTLTLQETNDLFAKFNSTYDPQHISCLGTDGVDESWAVKLMRDSEEDEIISVEYKIPHLM